MPANLNALIRYRTIDRCLSNPYREWTIGDLSEACASALKEHRGIYSGISERTIRDDIRVMRSDILGFNAPIVQSGGHYTYEDRDYSIFNVSIRESGLLTRVLDFILEIRKEIDHPELEKIIESITEAISGTPHLKKSAPGIAPKIEESLDAELDFIELRESRIYKQTKGYDVAKLSWAVILKLIDR